MHPVLCLLILGVFNRCIARETEKQMFKFIENQEKIIQAHSISNRELEFLKSYKDGKPVSITLYYEALCPFCRMFMAEQLYPSYKRLKDTNIIKNVTLVPFGLGYKSRLPNGQHVYLCQHGEEECQLNILHNCIIHYSNYDFRKFLRIIDCIEDSEQPLKRADFCVRLGSYFYNLDFAAVNKCRKGKEGNDLLFKASLLTDELFRNTKQKYVPYILINGKHIEAEVDMAQDNLNKLLVEKYIGETPTYSNDE